MWKCRCGAIYADELLECPLCVRPGRSAINPMRLVREQIELPTKSENASASTLASPRRVVKTRGGTQEVDPLSTEPQQLAQDQDTSVGDAAQSE